MKASETIEKRWEVFAQIREIRQKNKRRYRVIAEECYRLAVAQISLNLMEQAALSAKQRPSAMLKTDSAEDDEPEIEAVEGGESPAVA